MTSRKIMTISDINVMFDLIIACDKNIRQLMDFLDVPKNDLEKWYYKSNIYTIDKPKLSQKRYKNISVNDIVESLESDGYICKDCYTVINDASLTYAYIIYS